MVSNIQYILRLDNLMWCILYWILCILFGVFCVKEQINTTDYDKVKDYNLYFRDTIFVMILCTLLAPIMIIIYIVNKHY